RPSVVRLRRDVRPRLRGDLRRPGHARRRQQFPAGVGVVGERGLRLVGTTGHLAACAGDAAVPGERHHLDAGLLTAAGTLVRVVAFGGPPSPWVGWLLAVGIAGAAIGRLWSRFAGSSLNPR